MVLTNLLSKIEDVTNHNLHICFMPHVAKFLFLEKHFYDSPFSLIKPNGYIL